MKVEAIVTGNDLTKGIRFYGESHYDSKTIERLKELAVLMGEVFFELESLERQVKGRYEASAKEIKCQLDIMRDHLLWIAFGEEIAEEVIRLLDGKNDT